MRECDKDCIDKSGTEIALSGRSECFGREVSGGGDQGRRGRQTHLVSEKLVAADLTSLQQTVRRKLRETFNGTTYAEIFNPNQSNIKYLVKLVLRICETLLYFKRILGE